MTVEFTFVLFLQESGRLWTNRRKLHVVLSALFWDTRCVRRRPLEVMNKEISVVCQYGENYKRSTSITQYKGLISIFTPMYIKQSITLSYKADFEGKAIPVTDLGKPWGFQGVEAPRISRQSAYGNGKVVSLMHRPPLPTHEIFLVLFSVRGWATPRLEWGRQEWVDEIFQWHYRESNPRPSTCNAVPQPTASPRTPMKWTLVRTNTVEKVNCHSFRVVIMWSKVYVLAPDNEGRMDRHNLVLYQEGRDNSLSNSCLEYKYVSTSLAYCAHVGFVSRRLRS